jgi:hypothetical protein
LKSCLVFLALWLVSIVVVGVLLSAQTQREVQAPVPRPVAPIISGPDFGFRPEGWKGKARTGTFVVKINGEWVDAVESASFRPSPVAK